VSTEQRENLEAVLRQSAFPAGIDVSEQRRLLREVTSAQRSCRSLEGRLKHSLSTKIAPSCLGGAGWVWRLLPRERALTLWLV
jgi:hypothetical protein